MIQVMLIIIVVIIRWVFASPKAIGNSHRLQGGVNKKRYPVYPVDPV
jgi:hypothetical protein